MPPFALSAGVCQATPGDTAGDVVCRALAALRWADLNGPDMSFRYAPDVVEHSAEVYGIDASGKITTVYPANFQPRTIVHDVPLLASQ